MIKDPQLRANDIVVPLEGAGGNLEFTISSPLQVHDVAKVPARRAPELGEHSDEILAQLGFSTHEIEGLHTSGTVPSAQRARAHSGDARGRSNPSELSSNQVDGE